MYVDSAKLSAADADKIFAFSLNIVYVLHICSVSFVSKSDQYIKSCALNIKTQCHGNTSSHVT